MSSSSSVPSGSPDASVVAPALAPLVVGLTLVATLGASWRALESSQWGDARAQRVDRELQVDEVSHRAPRLAGTRHPSVMGAPWTAIIQSPPLHEARAAGVLPLIGSVAGTALSLLVAALAWFLVRGRRRADPRARAMNDDLLAANARLVGREGELRAFFDSPAVGIVLSKTGERPEEVNDRACAMLGYSREEFLRLSWEDVTHPDHLAADLIGMNRLRTGESDRYVVDKRFTRKDGSEIWVLLSVYCIRNPDHGVARYVGIMEDITERKRAEESVRRSAESFRQVFHALPIPLALTSSNPEVVRINRRFTEVLGYGRGDIPTMDEWCSRAFPDPGYRDRASRAWAEALRRAAADGGDVRPTEIRVTCKDGSSRVMVISGSPIGGDLLVALVDITERKEAELALRASEERLHRALAGSRQVEWEYDRVKDAHVVGREWAGVTGRTVEDCQSSDRWLALVHPEDRARVGDSIGRCIRGEAASYQAEYRVSQPEGGWRWLRSSGRALDFDADGRPLRISGTLMDVTDLKNAQARVRTAERLASTATLVRGMAHEINNPLVSVVSGLFLVRERLEKAAREAAHGAPCDPAAVLHGVEAVLDDAAKSALRIRDIVADLRSFALGTLLEGPATAVLADGVRNARRIAAQDLARCASFEADVPDISDLAISEGGLVQLLAHLLINAGQATGAEPNHVRVRAVVQDAGRVEIKVSDTGVGMSEATKARIFEPFFTTRDVGQGRGLGLSVCLGIVLAAGGEIAVSSQLGAGTTVTILLPRSAAPGGATPSAAER